MRRKLVHSYPVCREKRRAEQCSAEALASTHVCADRKRQGYRPFLIQARRQEHSEEEVQSGLSMQKRERHVSIGGEGGSWRGGATGFHVGFISARREDRTRLLEAGDVLAAGAHSSWP